MTAQEREDMAYFQQMLGEGGMQSVYTVSSGATADDALRASEGIRSTLDSLKAEGCVSSYRGCANVVVNAKQQAERLGRWRAFVERYSSTLLPELEQDAMREGFSHSSFDPFKEILLSEYPERSVAHFSSLLDNLFNGYLAYDSIAGEYVSVDVVQVCPDKNDRVKDCLNECGVFCFDLVGLNSAIANQLSDNFNYIGWMCGLIVFFFLWLSMGSIELAIISFVPMAVSWLWILGGMSMLGVQFNIVNIILATFIFGQGDDYTIFMTEGACYEYAYRRKILASYKSSIVVSALIMFIGIGTLIIARHPALHSLAEVTIIGMFSVVLMAYVLPPMLFNFMVSRKGVFRIRPLYLLPVLSMVYVTAVFLLELSTFYILGAVLTPFGSSLRRRVLHGYTHFLFKFDIRHIPGLKYQLEGAAEDPFSRPVMAVCNHQSILDAAIFMALSPKCIIVSNTNPYSLFFMKKVCDWLGFITLSGQLEEDMKLMRTRIAEGYSIVIFPEGERNPKSSILRFHKGPFFIAEKLGLDILLVLVHGANYAIPRNGLSIYPGTVSVRVMPLIVHDDPQWGVGYVERTKLVHAYYKRKYAEMAAAIETPSFFRGFVLDRYRYKGVDVFREVKRALKAMPSAVEVLPREGSIVVRDRGYGELALTAALVCPSRRITVLMGDADRAALLRSSAEGVVENLTIVSELPEDVKAIDL
ncbi:MAG: 1-acyl-sn-glycerol-3-phosphate acyltransferase [Prevotellaceae bacterium]|nr:1-acyl-sn-glycerol-3-phosphate acyltransferase [Prevotellaceae bacterium]